MAPRRTPRSVSPNSFDPTTATGAPKPLAPAASHALELVLDGPVVLKTHTWQLRPDDKALMDSLQAWYHVRYGFRPTQWELFTRVLAEALAREGGVFEGALGAISRE